MSRINPIIVMSQHWRTERWSVDYVIANPDAILAANSLMGYPSQTARDRAVYAHERLLRSSHPIKELHEALAPFDGANFLAFNVATDALRQSANGGHFFHFDGFETKFIRRCKCPPYNRKTAIRSMRRTF